MISRSLHASLLSVTAAGVIFTPSQSVAEVTFIFDYDDVSLNNNIGFDDPSTGAVRRQALQDVGDYIGGLLDHTATITYEVRASQTDGTGFLASAGSSYGLAFETNSIFGSNLAQNIQSNTNASQGNMTVDFGYAWHVGTSAPEPFEFDFRTTALHEITHSLGFASLFDEVTGDGLNATSMGNFFGETFSQFDTFLVDGTGTHLVNSPAANGQAIGFNSASFTDGPDGDDVIDILTSGNNLFFEGPNAVAEYGGPVPIYAPAIYAPGSSTGHLNTNDPTLADDPMLHAVNTGEQRRTYTDLDIAILKDLGFSIVPVPEPSSTTLLGTALFMLLGVRKRK